MWKQYEKILNERAQPSREARLSALVAVIRGHIDDQSLSDADCLAKIEFAIMDFDAVQQKKPTQ